MWPFKKNYKKKSRGGGAAPAGSPTPPGPFGGKRRVLRAAEVQLLGPQVPDPGGRGLTGRRWRAARREQAGGPAEGVTRERGLCPAMNHPAPRGPGSRGLSGAGRGCVRLGSLGPGFRDTDVDGLPRPATRGLGAHRTRSRQSPGPPSLGGDGEVPARQGGRENPLQVLAARRGRDACRTALPVSRTGSIPGIMQQVTGTSSLAQAPRTPQGPWPSLRRVSHSSVLGREGTDSCSPRLRARPRQCRTEGGP